MSETATPEPPDENNEDDARRSRDLRILRSHTAQLSEHFDSVEIFVTRKHPGGTINAEHGDGNWYARYGQVRQWVISEEERMRHSVRSDDD